MKTIIIGAGFTGLAAGIKTGETIYEATDKPGGICRDYEKDGFKFSNGGPHWIFGKDKGLEYIKTLVEVKEYERKAGVYYNHTFPYPFQNFATHEDFSLAGGFKDWCDEAFGQVQCNLFFHPFNEKYTAGLYENIIPQDTYKSPRKGAGWVSTFCDPVNGLSDLVDKMASQCDIKYNSKVVEIRANDKVLIIDNGKFKSQVMYDRLVSTIPLNNMMKLCGQDCKLPYTSVLVINIGAEPGINLPKEHWLYIPFCNSGFHRVAFYTNVDPSKAPQGKVGLSIEIAYLPQEGRKPDVFLQENIFNNVVKELQSWGWIGRVKTYNIDYVPCAYTWQYDRESRENAINWLKERDIISTGRYGKWEFQGLTKSIEDGFNVEDNGNLR